MSGIQPICVSITKGGNVFNILNSVTLPAIVIENQIVLNTPNVPSNVYVSTNPPFAPYVNDAWILMDESEHSILLTQASPFVRAYLKAARQWNGVEWRDIGGHYGQNGVWVDFTSTLPPIGTPLSSCTPAEIKAIADAGLADTYWNIGDITTFSINGVSYEIEITDFNHDDKADGSGKAWITLGMKNCLGTTYRMNATNTNVGGYTGSAMRRTLNNTIFPQISSEWRTVMSPVIKRTSAGNRSTVINSSTETIFLFSEVEIRGTQGSGSAVGEGTHYPKFSTVASRIKTRAGAASNWWLRSPYSRDSISFCLVLPSGNVDITAAYGEWGAAFGFCI